MKKTESPAFKKWDDQFSEAERSYMPLEARIAYFSRAITPYAAARIYLLHNSQKVVDLIKGQGSAEEKSVTNTETMIDVSVFLTIAGTDYSAQEFEQQMKEVAGNNDIPFAEQVRRYAATLKGGYGMVDEETYYWEAVIKYLPGKIDEAMMNDVLFLFDIDHDTFLHQNAYFLRFEKKPESFFEEEEVVS